MITIDMAATWDTDKATADTVVTLEDTADTNTTTDIPCPSALARLLLRTVASLESLVDVEAARVE